jgi:cobalt-zinc-cadmium efflux system outer membrane protein
MRLALATCVALACGACAAVEDDIAGDVATLGDDVRARTGAAPAAWQRTAADAERAAAAVRTLLATPLDEDAAIKIALLNNTAVQIAYEDLGVARADLVQAGLLRNPVLDADAKFFSGGTEIELGLLQPFLDLFFRPLRARVAAHEFAAVQATLTRDLVHLAFDVRREFVRVRAAQRVLALQTQIRDLAAGAFELMGKLHAAGNVTDPQLTAERVALARARLDLDAAEQAAREAREPLHVLMGLWGADVGWRIAEAPADVLSAELHTAHVEARAIAASLDLAHNRAALAALAQRAGLSGKEGWLPGAALGAAGKHEASGDWGVGPALALDLPLFDAGRAATARVHAQLRAALQQQVQLAIATRSAARLLRDRSAAAAARVAFSAAELLPASARFVHETAQNYNAMQIGAFDVLRARRQEVEALRDHQLAVRDASIARLDLEELLAGAINHEALAPREPRLQASAATASADH